MGILVCMIHVANNFIIKIILIILNMNVRIVKIRQLGDIMYLIIWINMIRIVCFS
jgi:hypothetical protein